MVAATSSGVRAGVAWLAVHGPAPVVPVAMLGSRRTGETTRARARACAGGWWSSSGAPVAVDLPDGTPRREAVARTADAVGEALAAHVQDAAARHGMPLPEDDPRATG